MSRPEAGSIDGSRPCSPGRGRCLYKRSYGALVAFLIGDDNGDLGWDGQPLRPCRLDFYCDHGAQVPLWIMGSGMAIADSLPVTDDLRQDLLAFQRRWEAGEDDFEVGRAEYDGTGRALVDRVRSELGPGWSITSPWDE